MPPHLEGPENELEVNKVSFSPDGILLAVARSDNSAYVYDTRYLKQKELYLLRHPGERASLGQGREYGMTAATWQTGIGGKGLGLITASIDGMGCTYLLWN